MAVTFTPNIGLAKPTKTELGLEWARNTKLQEDNNLIMIDKMDVNLITYTPVAIGPTTNPSNGVGIEQGEYFEVQGYIFGIVTVPFTDPGVAAGSGTGAYGISLPTLVDTTFHNVGTTLNDVPGTASCIGEGSIRDASSVNFSATCAVDVVSISGTFYARLITEAYTGKTSRFWGPGVPAAVATDDQVSFNFFYKKG